MNNKTILLNTLRKNSRTRISIISRNTNIPVSTLHMELRKLENKIIKKHVSLVDFEEKGYIRIIVILENPMNEYAKNLEFKNYLNNLYRIPTGYIADCVFRSSKHLSDFKESLSRRRIKYSIHPILNTLKVEELRF